MSIHVVLQKKKRLTMLSQLQALEIPPQSPVAVHADKASRKLKRGTMPWTIASKYGEFTARKVMN